MAEVNDSLRHFPSSLPVRSPSPDTKNSNRLNRTVSPAIDVSRHSPSLRSSNRVNDEYETLKQENRELKLQLSSLEQVGGGTFSSEEINRLRKRIKEQEIIIMEYRKEREMRKSSQLTSSFLRQSNIDTIEDLKNKLVDKDRIISELKKILARMTEASPTQKQYMTHGAEDFRDKIKALELQNERLGEMVKKFNKRDHSDKSIERRDNTDRILVENRNLHTRIEELLMENNELQQKIGRLKKTQSEEIMELTKINSALANQLKIVSSLEEKNRVLQIENQKLVKLLRDSQRSLHSGRSLEEEIVRLQAENKGLKEKSVVGTTEKVTITKIKEQYSANLKIFKETVYDEVSKEFQKFEATIKVLHSKLDLIEQKTDRMYESRRVTIRNPESKSPDVRSPPVVNKNMRSSETYPYQTPKVETTKKVSQPRLFDPHQSNEVRSEVEDDAQIFKLQSELLTQRRQKNELSERYNQLTADYNSLNQAHVSSLSDIQQYLHEISKLKNTIDELRLSLESTKKILDEKRDELSETRSELVQNRNALDETKDQLESTKEQLQTANSNFDIIKKNLDKTRDQLDEVKIELQEARRQLITRQAIILEVKQEKADSERSLQEQVTRARQASATQADRVRNKYESEVRQLKRLTEDQIGRLTDTYNQEIIVLRQNIEQKSRQLLELQRMLKAREAKVQVEMSEKQSIITKLTNENNHLKDRLNELDSHRKDSEHVEETRRRSYSILQENFNALSRRLKEVQIERDELELQNTHNREELDRLRQETSSIITDISRSKQILNQQYDELLLKHSDLNHQNLRLQDQCRELTTNNAHLLEQVTKLRTQLEQARLDNLRDFELRKTDIDNLLNQAEEVKAVLVNTNLVGVFDQILRVLSEMNEYKQTMLSRITIISKQSNIAELNFKNQLSKLERQNKLLQLKLETLEKEVEIRMAQVQTLRGLLDQKTRTIETTSTTFSSFSASLQVDPQAVERVQMGYNEGFNKLQKLIKELQRVRAFEIVERTETPQ